MKGNGAIKKSNNKKKSYKDLSEVALLIELKTGSSSQTSIDVSSSMDPVVSCESALFDSSSFSESTLHDLILKPSLKQKLRTFLIVALGPH